MKICWLLFLVIFLVESPLFGEPPEPRLSVKLNKSREFSTSTSTAIQTKMLALLESSNFNSKDDADSIFPEGIHGVHRHYREAAGGQFLLLTFAQPREFHLVRGHATVAEILIGMNNSQYADSLFTIDPDGRVIEHVKFSGQRAVELFEMVQKAVNG